MQSPGPNSKPPASTSTPAANGENAVNPDKKLAPNPTQPVQVNIGERQVNVSG
jgi:hypothetical protein